jgi:FlaA1/EpsC-like NDP-sugar epimerase
MKSFNRNHFIILVVDILLVVGSLFLAYWVRFDFDTGWFMRMLAHRWVLPFIVFSKLGSFYFFNLYRGMWRYTSTIDLLNIIKACSISSLLIVSVILFSDLRFVGFPRAVFVIDWVFSILLISGFRLFVRFNYEFSGEDKSPIALIRTLLQIVMANARAIPICSSSAPVTAATKFSAKSRAMPPNATMSSDFSTTAPAKSGK